MRGSNGSEYEDYCLQGNLLSGSSPPDCMTSHLRTWYSLLTLQLGNLKTAVVGVLR
jgi:hypothetical protein